MGAEAQVIQALVAAILPTIRTATRRYICTAAQDETPVHARFWRKLHLYGRAIGAEILVGGFTYNKSLFEDHQTRSGVFDEMVRPYLEHGRVDMGPVSFAAEMNILPTAVRPLNGLQTYTRGRPTIFPHAKIQLESLPAMGHREVPIIATTGACTIPNYVEKKAGQKAKSHHKIGAAIVEMDGDGDWFIRQIDADAETGDFQDLDAMVNDAGVSFGHRVEAITWGDIHLEQIDAESSITAWGYDPAARRIITRDTMLDALRPRHQFFHDLLDFRARNHHRRQDPYHHVAMLASASDDVEAAVLDCTKFLRATYRTWSQSVVVESNHDRALARWLKETDWRSDPRNALPYLRWNHRTVEAIATKEPGFNVFHHALAEADPAVMTEVQFVPQDGTYVVAGVECGMHGDDGVNGARASLAGYLKLSQPSNVGHSHTAGILDEMYQAGVNGSRDMGYNHGPSSWTPSDIVTYASGKRTIVTKRGRKWRA